MRQNLIANQETGEVKDVRDFEKSRRTPPSAFIPNDGPTPLPKLKPDGSLE